MNELTKIDRSTPQAIGERIAALRKSKELSQAALAKLCSLSQQTIGALESGRVSNPGSLPIIAQYLNVSAEYLRYGRAKGVPILSNASRNDSFPVPGVDVSPTSRMLQTLTKHSQRAFAFKVDDDACASIGIYTGDIVAVEPELAPSPKYPVCVRYRGILVVRLYKDLGESVKYVSDNDLFATLDDTNCEFIGTIIQVTRTFI